ncbi:4-aminobutyrate aminotransferase [Microvirga sp. 3-52]|uniref:4-aminobutyrate aminotransferase n=1 Tax=Microvirga sp. 3-52 TaxID=2792425 RepID=UPI001AC8017B|nr:4-aminobutyrate aminotransferase [Microvirga sp. 3-52]MBO1909354.1 4-aminobutyrate aminotransferase [Microvirga sp. 3-52]MBS7455419.1 4-aminobutyrate aminotransferase [Microvirga sp. 3-52]
MVRLKRPAPALACILVLSASAALAQTNSAHRSADVVAGKPHRLGVYGNVQKDCTSGPLPTVRVVTPPRHGELNVRSGKLKAGRISRCPKLEATAQGIFYKASPTYKGADEVSYEVRSASGKVESHTVRITVKDTQAPDAKPDQDAEL